MKRNTWFYIIAIGLILFLVLFLTRSYDVEPPSPASERAQDPIPETSALPPPSSTEALSAERTVIAPEQDPKHLQEQPALRFQAILRGTNPSQTRATMAQVAVMRISPVDLREFRIAQQEESQGAGPNSVMELAHIVEWLEAPLKALPDGTQQLGPLEVAPADKYRVIAWQEDYEYFTSDYESPGVEPEGNLLDAGVIEGRLPTGARLRFVNPLPGQSDVLAAFGRSPLGHDGEDTQALLHMMEQVRPDLYDALLDEAQLALAASGTETLTPLLPREKLRLRLSTLHGAEAEELIIELQDERTLDVLIDLSGMFSPEDALAVHLQGRVVHEASEEPVEGAIVRCITCPMQYEETTSADGTFSFLALPASRISQFEVVMPPDDRTRLHSPKNSYFTIEKEEALAAPEGATPTERHLEVEWKIPTYRWVVLQLPDSESHPVRAKLELPFPIHMLQVMDETSQTWRSRGAREFIPEEEGIAVSVTESGIYRILTAVSSLEIYSSEPAILRDEDREALVRLDDRQLAPPRELSLQITRDGLPLGNAVIFARSLFSSLPSAEFLSDHHGHAALGTVAVEDLYAEIYWNNELFFEGTVDLDRAEANVIPISGNISHQAP